jgi:hypothetical protein
MRKICSTPCWPIQKGEGSASLEVQWARCHLRRAGCVGKLTSAAIAERMYETDIGNFACYDVHVARLSPPD